MKNRRRHILQVFPGGMHLPCDHGETFHDVLARRFPSLAGTCGGKGTCGRCRILIDPAPEPSAADRRLILPDLLGRGWRLACGHAPNSDVRVHLLGRPGEVQVEEGSPIPAAAAPMVACLPADGGCRIAAGRRTLERMAAPPDALLGAAVDIGTTSVSVELVDLGVHASLGVATIPNPQTSFGADILSRFEAARRPDGLERLRRPLNEAIGSAIALLSDRAGRGRYPVWGVAAAGNPVMAAIFAGRIAADRPGDLWQTLPDRLDASRIPELRLHPRGEVRLLPAGGGFVGGDVIGGLLHTGVISRRGEPTLFIDLGTNGEIALRLADGRILAASTAAGPALEGAGLSHGMRATVGAVSAVSFNGDLICSVVGGGAPMGLCGSGALDLLAVLLRTGLVLEDGRFLSASEAGRLPLRRLAARRRDIDGEPVFYVSDGPGGAVVITQGDVRNIQLALGAIKAGVGILLRTAGIGLADVGRVTIAGAFGSGLRRETLAVLGVVPAGWPGRLEFAGNSSLAGARDCLLDRRQFLACRRIARRMLVLDLATEPAFSEAFLRGMRLTTSEP